MKPCAFPISGDPHPPKKKAPLHPLTPSTHTRNQLSCSHSLRGRAGGPSPPAVTPRICSWSGSRSWWPCPRGPGSRWSPSATAPGAPCTRACGTEGAAGSGQQHRTGRDTQITSPCPGRSSGCHPRGYGARSHQDPAALPDVGDPLLVLRLAGPDGDLVPLGADVDDGPAHLVAVLVEHLPNKAQELQGRLRWSCQGSEPRRGGDTTTTTTPPPDPTGGQGAALTVSSQKRSSSVCLCCLARVMSQRPPRLFWLSSHMGSMPSWGRGRAGGCSAHGHNQLGGRFPPPPVAPSTRVPWHGGVAP